MSEKMDHLGYLKMAVDEAFKGMRSGAGGPFGALIVLDGLVIGKGHNTVLQSNDPTAHAEMLAISAAADTLAYLRLAQTQRRLVSEVTSAWKRHQKLQSAVFTYLDEALVAHTASVLLAEESYRTGKIDLGEVLTVGNAVGVDVEAGAGSDVTFVGDAVLVAISAGSVGDVAGVGDVIFVAVRTRRMPQAFVKDADIANPVTIRHSASPPNSRVFQSSSVTCGM